MSIHTIQLRGPWSVAVSNEDRQCLFAGTINVRRESDWMSWMASLEEDPWPTEVAFRRRFNWPHSTSISNAVFLVIDGVCPDRITLNEIRLQSSPDEETARCNVRDLLKDKNQLEIVFESGNPGFSEPGSQRVSHLLRSVVLEIVSSDH